MTSEKIRSVIAEYKKLFDQLGIRPKKLENYKQKLCLIEDGMAHFCWATHQVDGLLDQGRKEKAFRWLGFIQRGLFFAGLKSLDDLKNDSRPGTNKEILLVDSKIAYFKTEDYRFDDCPGVIVTLYSVAGEYLKSDTGYVESAIKERLRKWGAENGWKIKEDD